MVIAVNMNFLQHNLHKDYVPFLEELFTQFAAHHKQHQFFFIVPKSTIKSVSLPSNVQVIEMKKELKSTISIHYWYNIKLPLLLKKLKASYLFNADGISSLNVKIAQILVVHNITITEKSLSSKYLSYYKKYTEKFLLKATHIIACSTIEKKNFIENYPTVEKKINLLSPAANAHFKILPWQEHQPIKNTYTDGKEYFFCHLNIHPHNNITNILKAFSIFKKWQKSNMKLVIAGNLYWNKNEFDKLINTYKYKEELIVLNELSIVEIGKLTSAAYCAIYPITQSDIAYPIIEAMQAEVPIIGSNMDSVRELGGEAILYANPLDIEDIAGKMQIIYKNENLRSKHIELGKIQVKQYSWEKSISTFSQLIGLPTGF
jgi:glycosyltransferase involved in cell wall biosynthesis